MARLHIQVVFHTLDSHRILMHPPQDQMLLIIELPSKKKFITTGYWLLRKSNGISLREELRTQEPLL